MKLIKESLLIISLALLSLAWVMNLKAETLIIHEKLVGSDWVLATTPVPQGQEIETVYQQIEANHLTRINQDTVKAGVRLGIQEIPGQSVVSWVPDDSRAGAVFVFWAEAVNGIPSPNPAKYFIEELPDIEAAETFITLIANDESKVLWDNRPFQITEEFNRVETVGPVVITLTSP